MLEHNQPKYEIQKFQSINSDFDSILIGNIIFYYILFYLFKLNRLTKNI